MLGKLLASLLSVLVMLAAALPVFLLVALLGGVSYGQIARAFAVTLAAVLACGSLGSMLALWREKTFQALAMTVLALVLWLALGEIVAAGVLGASFGGLSCRALAAGISPWQAILEATRPYVQAQPALGPLGTPVNLFVVVAAGITVLVNGVAMAMVRVWNPSRETDGRRWSKKREEKGEQERAEADRGVRSRLGPAPSPQDAAGVGQSRSSARDSHLGLRPEDPRRAAGVSGAVRPGCGESVRRRVRGRGAGPRGAWPPARSTCRSGQWSLIAAEPGVGQRPGGHVVDQRTRRRGARPVAGDRPDAEGDRLRQARRRVLQHQGDGVAADAAVRGAVAHADAEPGEPVLSAGRAWPCCTFLPPRSDCTRE